MLKLTLDEKCFKKKYIDFVFSLDNKVSKVCSVKIISVRLQPFRLDRIVLVNRMQERKASHNIAR